MMANRVEGPANSLTAVSKDFEAGVRRIRTYRRRKWKVVFIPLGLHEYPGQRPVASALWGYPNEQMGRVEVGLKVCMTG